MFRGLRVLGVFRNRSLPVAQVRRAEQFFIGEPGERGSSDVSMPQCIPDEPSTPKTPIKPRIIRYDVTRLYFLASFLL